MTTPGDLINPSQLKSLVDASQCRPVDCRHSLFDPAQGRKDYLGGHIPGAVHADMDRDLAGAITPDSGRHPLPDPDSFRRQLGSWGIGDNTYVVVYDYGNGSLAARLWWMLRCWMGHKRVSVLDGGIADWIASGGAIETSVPSHELAEYPGVANDAAVATTEEIAGIISSDGALNLIDARDAARYRGEVEPIDSVAGHIPGAQNMPLGGNLTADGRWRSVRELEAIWSGFLAPGEQSGAIAMCGSGVTGCHLILSAVLAGLPAPRLYVGSWSEWIRDEERPVSTTD